MTPETPVLDVLIVRDGTRWRLCFAPSSWRTPFLSHMDARGDVFPVSRPDLGDLDRFMWTPIHHSSAGRQPTGASR